jgi:hypothetical protein
LSYGRNFSPQELKRNWTSATFPPSSMTKIGPLSRIQESSIGISTGSTPVPQRRRMSSACPGLHSIVTGSNAATARATPAHSSFAASSSAPHHSSRAGQAISVP